MKLQEALDRLPYILARLSQQDYDAVMKIVNAMQKYKGQVRDLREEIEGLHHEGWH